MLFSGQTQLLTPGGVLPLGFEIEANTLAQAIDQFPNAVRVALEQAIEEAREMRREASSRIVVPEAGGGLGGMGGPAADASSSSRDSFLGGDDDAQRAPGRVRGRAAARQPVVG